MKELIDLTKNQRTPVVTAYLLRPLERAAGSMHYKLAKSTEWIFLHHLAVDVDNVYEPDHGRSFREPDDEILRLNAPYVDIHLTIPSHGQTESNAKTTSKKRSSSRCQIESIVTGANRRKTQHSPSERISSIPAQDYSDHVIRIILDKEKMVERDLEPVHVGQAVQTFLREGSDLPHRVLWSEANMEDWILRIRLAGFQGMRREALQDAQFRTLEKRICHQTSTRLLTDLEISGIPNIKKAHVRKVRCGMVDPKTGQMSAVDRTVVDTCGTNLGAMWMLDFIDWKNTISNDVHEINRLLGIEAAVNVLFHEIQTVLSFDGTYVNERHIATLVNTMTYRGYLMPINRHGLNKLPSGPLNKCTFEESVDILSEAAGFGMVDGVRGISSNIMLGQLPPAGTGIFIFGVYGTFTQSPDPLLPQAPVAYSTTPMSWSAMMNLTRWH